MFIHCQLYCGRYGHQVCVMAHLHTAVARTHTALCGHHPVLAQVPLDPRGGAIVCARALFSV